MFLFCFLDLILGQIAKEWIGLIVLDLRYNQSQWHDDKIF